MTQLKIGDKVAIDRSRCLASGNDWQTFEIIGETATLWRLSDGVQVTKKRLKVVGDTEKYAKPMTPAIFESISNRKREKEKATLHKKIWRLIGTATTIDHLVAIHDVIVWVLGQSTEGRNDAN